ncbi:MAG: YceD family protein [Porphyromonas sp.]|nr:YceD family protein [Porphyromonas sp.]
MKSPKTLEFQLDRSYWEMMDQEEILEGEVSASVFIEPVRDLYRVTFSFDGFVAVPCDRCLAPVRLDVDVEEEVSFDLGDELCDEDDKVIVLSIQDPKYDISILMYEMIVLSLPLLRTHDIEDCDPEMVRFLVSDLPDAGEPIQESNPIWDDLKKAISEKK